MPPGVALPPPITERGAVGWAYTNLFSTWYNTVLTFTYAAFLVLAFWFGLRWIVLEADWKVIATLGGRLIIGQYNTEFACPGQNCFWRPQVSLLLVTALLGMVWAVSGDKTAKRIAIGVAAVTAAFAFLPYSMDQMGLDVRLLLAANLPAVAVGWGTGPVHAAGHSPLDNHTGSPRFFGHPGLGEGSGGGSGPATRVDHLLGWPDAESAAGGDWHHPLPAHRHRPGPRTAQPSAVGQAAVRGVHRGVPGLAADYAPIHVPSVGAFGLPARLLHQFPVPGRGDPYPVQLGVHGGKYPGRFAGASSRPGGGGAGIGAAWLADHPANLLAPGHP